MSRAFVSEDAADKNAALLPERPISNAPNLVTRRGLALIDAEVARLAGLIERGSADDPARAAVARDLRYWRARRATAQLVEPPALPDGVGFGCLVTIRRANGSEANYRIVGEDEADPAQGLLAWTAPLAQALSAAEPGDVVEPAGGRAAVTVVRVTA